MGIVAGQPYGHLVAVKYHGRKNQASRATYWLCRCRCGVEKLIRTSSVGSKTKSCGCLHKEVAARVIRERGWASVTTHGLSGTKEWRAWRNIRLRCYDHNQEGYKHYGARGIKVCQRWLDSFENFIKDMGSAPGRYYQIDRIDSNGNYEPDNCRWATPKANNRNRRDNVLIEYRGQKKCIAAWAEEVGLSTSTLWRRLRVQKMTIEAALTKPSKKTKIALNTIA